MDIKAIISEFQNTLSRQGVTLVAVSKTRSNEEIMDAYQAGQRDFGENKVQELTDKAAELPDDIRWHMIGHLQRNKVKYIAPMVHLIHGVDSLKLLRTIEKEGKKNERIISCLLQVHIAAEDTKFGFDETEIQEAFKLCDELENVQISGLMGMATFTEDMKRVRQEFSGLKVMFDAFREQELPSNVSMEILSMGMSGDYELAIGEGSNMVRIGSAIFGERSYA